MHSRLDEAFNAWADWEISTIIDSLGNGTRNG